MSSKLLLADDSVTIQRVIELTFSGEDVQVLAVGDGEEAIARILIEKPDIVLADIGMPKRSGYEVSAFVKGHPDFSHIPVLLLAGAFEPVDDSKAQEVKCDGVLVKPFEPQHVVARVWELIRGAKGSPTQPAVPDVGRPVERLTPFRPVELPKRDDRLPIPDDLVDIGDADLDPRVEPLQPGGPDLALNGSLDDYFDRLDEAFSSISALPSSSGTAAATPDDRPALEREIESFGEPMLSEHSTSPLPTLDDLLSGMPSFSTPISFDTPAAPVIAQPSPQPSLDVPTSITVESPPMEPFDFTHAITPAPTEPIPSPGAHLSTPDVRATVSLENAPSRSVIADAFSALLAVEQGEPGIVPVRLNGTPPAPVVTDAMVDDMARRVSEKLAVGSSDQVGAIVRQVVSDVAERLVREEIARIRSQV